VKKRILIVAAVVLLAGVVAGAVLGALWYRDQTEEKVVRGSSTEEFVTTEAPETEAPRPKKEVKQVPWPLYGYDAARTKFAPEFKHRPPFRHLWNVQTHKYIEYPPAVANGRVFVANQRGDFLALNADTGRVIWQKRYARCVASGPAFKNGLVYLGVMNPLPCKRSGNRAAEPGFVTAVDAKTGKERWRFSTSVVESSPLVVGNFVYVGSWNRRIYALSARTGRVRWAYEADAEVNSSGAFADGTVFFGTDGGRLYALNAWTGALKWRASSFSRFGRREYFYATPAVAYGRVYIGNTDGTLYAYGAKSGKLLWAQSAGTYVYASAAIWDKKILLGTYDGRFSAFDAATGDVVWRKDVPSAVHGAATVIDGLVYFSTLSSTIAPNAQRYVKRGRRGSYALDARTGRLVWQWPGMGFYSPVVADEQRIYLVGSTRVVALQPKKGPVKDGAQKSKKAKKKKKRDSGGSGS
jgi:outer membrane protein assembly factor BamB